MKALLTHDVLELVGIFRDEILPHASVILPNQFEAEQLTGDTMPLNYSVCY